MTSFGARNFQLNTGHVVAESVAAGWRSGKEKESDLTIELVVALGGRKTYDRTPDFLRLADAIKLLRLLGELHVEVHEVERHGGDICCQQRLPRIGV